MENKEKSVHFAAEVSENFSPLSTGTLGASKNATGFSPIDAMTPGIDEANRPSTPTRSSLLSSTPFALSASSPNLLAEKPRSIFGNYRDSPVSKHVFNQSLAKAQEHIKLMEAHVLAAEQARDAAEKQLEEKEQQLRIAQEHINRQTENFQQRIEDAVRIEEESTILSKRNGELLAKIAELTGQLKEANEDISRLMADFDDKVSQNESLQKRIQTAEAELLEMAKVAQLASESNDQVSLEKDELREKLKLAQEEASQWRLKYMDVSDSQVSLERQRDALEAKIKDYEKKLEEAEAKVITETLTAQSLPSIHDMVQAEANENAVQKSNADVKSYIDIKMNEILLKLAQAQSVNTIPSAPPSVAANDFDDANSVKAETVSLTKSSGFSYEGRNHISTSSLPMGNDTVTIKETSESTLDRIDPIATSTWKRENSSGNILASTVADQSNAKVLDWLPTEPDDEEQFEAEARWNDKDFIRRTALGAASRKRLMQQEGIFSPSMAPTRAASSQKMSSDEERLGASRTTNRLNELQERNRRQPLHMRSAYPIEDTTFLVSENDLRTGKPSSVDNVVSSTPIHPDASKNPNRNKDSAQFRKPRVPLSSTRPTSMFETSKPKEPITPGSLPSSIPKPTQFIISPPNPRNQPVQDNKENKTKGGGGLMVFSPPSRKPAPKPERKAPKNGNAFVISPPQKQKPESKLDQSSKSSHNKSATSTPKKMFNAVARAFGSRNAANTNDLKPDV